MIIGLLMLIGGLWIATKSKNCFGVGFGIILAFIGLGCMMVGV